MRESHVDATGAAYIAGQTCSLDFPLANPLQAAPGGNCDAFISKVEILARARAQSGGARLHRPEPQHDQPATDCDAHEWRRAQTIANYHDRGSITLGDFAETNTLRIQPYRQEHNARFP